MPTVPTYPIALVVKIMGIDEHTIRRLARAGVLTRPTVRGEWPITIVAEYIRHVESQQRDDIDDTAEISPTAAANLLCISTRRLRQLAVERIVPRTDHGKYLVIGCVQGYIDYLQHMKSGDDERQAEALRLTTVRADSHLVDLQIKTGKLYDAEQVDQTLFGACTNLTAMLDGAASRIASNIGGGAQLRGALIDEFRIIRTQFAKHLRKFSRRIANSSSDNRSSDGRDAGKLGARKSRTAKG